MVTFHNKTSLVAFPKAGGDLWKTRVCHSTCRLSREFYRAAARSFALREPIPRRSLTRSEEHTSELQSLTNLVCRLLLEKKNRNNNTVPPHKHHTAQASQRVTTDHQ